MHHSLAAFYTPACSSVWAEHRRKTCKFGGRERVASRDSARRRLAAERTRIRPSCGIWVLRRRNPASDDGQWEGTSFAWSRFQCWNLILLVECPFSMRESRNCSHTSTIFSVATIGKRQQVLPPQNRVFKGQTNREDITRIRKCLGFVLLDIEKHSIAPCKCQK
jgi:hypothetical protein